MWLIVAGIHLAYLSRTNRLPPDRAAGHPLLSSGILQIQWKLERHILCKRLSIYQVLQRLPLAFRFDPYAPLPDPYRRCAAIGMVRNTANSYRSLRLQNATLEYSLDMCFEAHLFSLARLKPQVSLRK